MKLFKPSKKTFILGFFFGFISLTLNGQSFLNFTHENDIFFSDNYYTSGIFLRYGEQVETDVFNSLKTYRLFELGQEIYTPDNTTSIDYRDYDYPFGGWLYLKYTAQKEIKENTQIEYGIQMGVTGDWSMARWLQNTLHRNFFGMKVNSWEHQIPESIHVNVFAGRFDQIKILNRVWLLNNLYSCFGTQRIALGNRVGINIGNGFVLPLGENRLFFHNNKIGAYFGANTTFVLYDHMLSGSLYENNARFTAKSIPFRVIFEAGVTLQGSNWKAMLLYNQRSRDTSFQPIKRFNYLTMSLSYLF